MKNSFFSRFTPKEPKFFPLLKQLSEILLSSSALLIEILGHDSPEKRAEDYKRIKDLEREGDKLTKGLGAGADPNVGRDAAQEDRKSVV